MVNFGLRSKVFVNKVIRQSPRDNKDLHDALFERLFEMNYTELTESETISQRMQQSDMGVYAAWFLKILIKTLQSSNRCFDVTTIKKRIEDLIVNERLMVATNSLPMFLVVQMFFSTEQVRKDDNTDITKRLFSFIKNQINKVRTFHDGYRYPLLHFYQLRNLIQIYTQILSYFLCFQTPLNQKSSSSQLHTQHHQSQPSQPIDESTDTETQYLLRT